MPLVEQVMIYVLLWPAITGLIELCNQYANPDSVLAENLVQMTT